MSSKLEIKMWLAFHSSIIIQKFANKELAAKTNGYFVDHILLAEGRLEKYGEDYLIDMLNSRVKFYADSLTLKEGSEIMLFSYKMDKLFFEAHLISEDELANLSPITEMLLGSGGNFFDDLNKNIEINSLIKVYQPIVAKVIKGLCKMVKN
jgi:hypothetical protein